MARILIIEERPDTCYFMSLLLRTEGHDLAPYTSPGDALRAFGKGKFDAVILDMDSTTFDSLEIFEKIHLIDKAVRPILISRDRGRYIEMVKRVGYISEASLVDRPVTAAELAALVTVAQAGQETDNK